MAAAVLLLALFLIGGAATPLFSLSSTGIWCVRKWLFIPALVKWPKSLPRLTSLPHNLHFARRPSPTQSVPRFLIGGCQWPVKNVVEFLLADGYVQLPWLLKNLVA